MTAATIPDDAGKPEVVKFLTNIPVETALKFDTGRACTSQYSGDQVCFTLYDDRKMYVSPALAQKITELGIRRDVPFSITKKEVRVGNRKGVQWEIVRLDGKVPATEAGSGSNRKPAAEPDALQINGSQSNHTNGNGQAPVAPAPAAIEVAVALEGCGKAAIDTVLAVEAYARSKGRAVTFAEANIQDVWISLFIQAMKGGRG